MSLKWPGLWSVFKHSASLVHPTEKSAPAITLQLDKEKQKAKTAASDFSHEILALSIKPEGDDDPDKSNNLSLS